MSTYGEFYPSSNNDNCSLESTNSSGWVALSAVDANVVWRRAKFGNLTGANTVHAGGDSGTHSTGMVSSFVNSGFPPSDPQVVLGMTTSRTYLKFDTSSLEDDLEITGVKLGLYGVTKDNDYSASFGSPSIRIFAGLTGGNDRPTFSSPVNSSNDRNWWCENVAGCGSGTCNLNEGVSDVGTLAQSSFNTSARNEITLTDGTRASDGASTVYEDWINRTGDTYIVVTHNFTVNTSSSTVCNNSSDTFPATYPSTSTGLYNCFCSFSGGTSGNGPYLAINQGKSQFQMII